MTKYVQMIENFHVVNYSLYFVPESGSLVEDKYNKIKTLHKNNQRYTMVELSKYKKKIFK